MSTPASSCWRTMSPTARRTRVSNAAGSGMRPESSASSVVVRSWARGRLPVCVVRMRSVLSFMGSLLKLSYDLVGEVFDHAVLTVQRRIEHDLAEPLSLERLDPLDQLGRRPAQARRRDQVRRHEAHLVGIDEAVVAAVQTLMADGRWRFRQPVEIRLPDRPRVLRRVLAGLEMPRP